MLQYKPKLKKFSRQLRSNLTDSEQRLWFHLRRKQLEGIQFYRQKPIGNYIVDFYAPKAKLVIEIDGSQHFEEEHAKRDALRDSYLSGLGIHVLRFNNLEVLGTLDGVLEVILNFLKENPSQPPFFKGRS